MALARSAGLCRLALQTQWATVRLLGSTAAGGEPPSDEDKGRRAHLEAQRSSRSLRPPSERVRRSPLESTQPASSRSSFRFATLEQVQLNTAIQACASGEAVLDLVVARLAVLNEVNAATALMTLSRRVSKRDAAAWLSGDARFAQLLRAALSLFGRMRAQELSNSLYACGQLGITPPAGWLLCLWDASVAKLGEFKAQELSNTLYACGQLGITPPDGWLRCYWEASAVKVAEFNEQELSNTLYACGQLGVRPPPDWLMRYWKASDSKLGAFLPQASSNTLHAFAQLGITPPAFWLRHFWVASALKLCHFKPQELSNTLLACGLLDVKPPADWLQLFSSACGRALPRKTQQGLSNTALALAMLALWELPLWHGLWEKLCLSLSRDIAGWSAEDRLNAMQLFQAYQAAAVERPGLLPSPSPELLAAARKSWVDGLAMDLEWGSKLHAGVSACLTRMGVAHANERWCDKAERSIDIAIEGAAPVAVEVDGPYHFLQDGRQNGSTLLRNRMLKAHGWRVAVVDYRAWNEQRTEARREEYLRRLLA